MSSLSRNLHLEIACPACPGSYAVPLDVIARSQHLLDELGPCTGTVSYECPATYYAGLVTPDAVARLDGALAELERDARVHHAKAVWAEHRKIPLPGRGEVRLGKRRETMARQGVRSSGRLREEGRSREDEHALVQALDRWENEGGAPAEGA